MERGTGKHLDDEAIVVRGGVMLSGDLKTNAETHNGVHRGEWALSVGAANDLDAREICDQATFIRNKQVRLSTVGAIRSLGFDVRPSGRFPHADLHLDREPDEELWAELRSVFDNPIRRIEL